MYRKKIMFLFLVLFITFAGSFAAGATGLFDQRVVLSGEIVSVVKAGTHVEEGAELARVSTLTGSAAAARANAKGVVKEVLFQPGDMVQSGDIIARIAVE